MAVYIDTSAWIALREPRDRHHEDAKRTLRELNQTRQGLITAVHTVVEFIDGVAARRGQRAAAAMASILVENRVVRVIPSEPALPSAMEILSSRPDWKVDLSDCLSFALMQRHGIQHAFTYDSDFDKAGFERVG